ncbi:hypothetical protein NQ314_017688 [Rhamnusium bicolor]|uniref:Uncharacterized protein n=1 Tax=Rhamnusium bicolor TaxID=1586634 RepID=A0AAV8WT33_9CUCU|nr:hypothetical protein NQ314_017688 [Rhamnusium bicolor]
MRVAKVLMLLENGRGREYRGKRLNEINLKTDIYYSSESDGSESEQTSGGFLSEKMLQRFQRRGQLVLLRPFVLLKTSKNLDQQLQVNNQAFSLFRKFFQNH